MGKVNMAVKADEVTKRDYRKRAELGRILVKEEVQARIKLVTTILKKDKDNWTKDEQHLLDQSPEIVCQVTQRLQKSNVLKERTKEVEDREPILREKCAKLADAIRKAKSVVVYTGAGISTAASIPDYRGPNGVWTLLQKGVPLSNHNLSDAEPTLTHMALAELRRKRCIAHVVSQNCDGLHLRSGLARTSLSEVHGNMFIEVCKSCKPHREYVRLFDVTERTSLHRHKTGRRCDGCGQDLIDTIVHFGERGTLKSPLNWSKAISVAKKCDLIICIGSSLKVLRKYNCLWGTTRPLQERPMLYIVNLQWTPKDHMATMKINGRCDNVMLRVMKKLGLKIPTYVRDKDPLFKLAVPLTDFSSSSSSSLSSSNDVESETLKDETQIKSDLKNLIENGENALSTLSSTDICAIVRPKERKTPCKLENEEIHLVTDTMACNSKDSIESTSTAYEAKVNVSTNNEGEESKDEDCSTSANSSTYGWFGKGYRKNMKRRKRH